MKIKVCLAATRLDKIESKGKGVFPDFLKENHPQSN